MPDAASLRVGAPIARPSAVVCIGMNYAAHAAHAAESGVDARPARGVLKTPNTVGGPDDPVAVPPGSDRTDWEVELGVVMVFGFEHLVWHLSQYLALEPGDLVLTGTPEGVALSGRFPYLSAGDVVEVEIEGLGHQRHEMVAAAAAAQEER